MTLVLAPYRDRLGPVLASTEYDQAARGCEHIGLPQPQASTCRNWDCPLPCGDNRDAQ
jgi:hypothetical protein